MKEPFEGKKEEPSWLWDAFLLSERDRDTAQDFLIYSIGTVLVLLGLTAAAGIIILLVWVCSKLF